MPHPPCTPPTRASVGAFHAHEGDDGEEEGEEKEAVKKFCERGSEIASGEFVENIPTVNHTYQ